MIKYKERCKGGIDISVVFELQMNIFMSILLSITLGHSYLKLNRKNSIYKLFIITNFFILVIIILEILSVICNKTELIHSVMFHKLVNIVGFILTPFPIFFMFILFNKWIYKRKLKFNRIILLSIPIFINLVLSIFSYKYGCVFEVSQENDYSRGFMFFISPLTSSFYFILNLVFLWGNKKYFDKEEVMVFNLIVLMPCFISCVQLINLGYLTIWTSWGIAIITLYIFLLHDRASKDSLTELGNREAFTNYINCIKKKKNLKLTAINIDLDGLKFINDNYGHNEGDVAIRKMASLIDEVFGARNKTIRLGGDEFIIFIESDNELIVYKYLNRLIWKLNQYNKRSNKSYKLKFSYGIGIYNEKEETIEELLERCDSEMYEQKNSKY